MDWYNVESMTEPVEVDSESSGVYNYVRRNITPVEVEQDGETVTKYTWEECRIPKESWGLYEAYIQVRADTDFALMMIEE